MKASARRCKLAKSMILGRKVSDAYGVFATQPIRKGETLFVDHTVMAVFDKARTCLVCFKSLGFKAKKMVCCPEKFCSQSRIDKALASFHQAICGKSFTFPGLKHMSASSRNRTMMLLRILAIIVQTDDGHDHPLSNPAVNCLTPQSGPQPWTYHEDVIYPVAMLQKMGIDIFADFRYDTFVIRNISNRIKNNSCTQASRGEENDCAGLNPLYAMFNHSCHPNTGWEHLDGTPSIRIYAEKDIVHGEELFIRYMGEMRFNSYEEQQERLKGWLNGGCGCVRCKVDSTGSKAEQRAYYLKHLETCGDALERAIFFQSPHSSRIPT